jgi:hypothetical protein
MIRLFSACASLCALFAMPASAQNILEGVVSINVTMTTEETCIASQYGVGNGYHGKRTANGERFNTYALTAARRIRSFGSHITVTNKANGRSVRVRINDCGPFIKGAVSTCLGQQPRQLAWTGRRGWRSNEMTSGWDQQIPDKYRQRQADYSSSSRSGGLRLLRAQPIVATAKNTITQLICSRLKLGRQ